MKICWVLAALCVALGPTWWAGAAEGVLTNADIVRLAKSGIGDAVIVAMIESSGTDFETGVDAVLELSAEGVGDPVIAAMVASAGTRRGEGEGTSAAATAPATRGGEPSASAAPQPKAIAGSTFRESLRSGSEGPEMVVIPAGSFRMGCLSNDSDCYDDEKPVHEVTISAPFALSVHEVTFEDYDRFTYPNKVDDEGRGRGRRPVINVSWDDAQEYAAWLSSETGGEYRLPSESEWEYAARAGTTTKYSWGDEIGRNRANCFPEYCGDQWGYTAPVGSFRANRFGLYDMHGNVWEWVADCWNARYAGAPADGNAWLSENCSVRVLRVSGQSRPFLTGRALLSASADRARYRDPIAADCPRTGSSTPAA